MPSDAHSHRYRHVVTQIDDPFGAAWGAVWLVYTPATGPELINDIVQRGRFWTQADAMAFAAVLDEREGRDLVAPLERLTWQDQEEATDA